MRLLPNPLKQVVAKRDPFLSIRSTSNNGWDTVQLPIKKKTDILKCVQSTEPPRNRLVDHPLKKLSEAWLLPSADAQLFLQLLLRSLATTLFLLHGHTLDSVTVSSNRPLRRNHEISSPLPHVSLVVYISVIDESNYRPMSLLSKYYTRLSVSNLQTITRLAGR